MGNRGACQSADSQQQVIDGELLLPYNLRSGLEKVMDKHDFERVSRVVRREALRTGLVWGFGAGLLIGVASALLMVSRLYAG